MVTTRERIGFSLYLADTAIWKPCAGPALTWTMSQALLPCGAPAAPGPHL